MIKHKNKCQNDSHRIYAELNAFRNNPNILIEHLQYRKGCYTEQKYLLSELHSYCAIRTVEGNTAIDKLINQLTKKEDLCPITRLGILNHLANIILQQLNQLKSPDFRLSEQALVKYRSILSVGQYQFPNRIYCLRSTSFRGEYESLINLLIDDGNIERTNRQILMDHNQHYVGIQCCSMPDLPELQTVVYLFTTIAHKKD